MVRKNFEAYGVGARQCMSYVFIRGMSVFFPATKIADQWNIIRSVTETWTVNAIPCHILDDKNIMRIITGLSFPQLSRLLFFLPFQRNMTSCVAFWFLKQKFSLFFLFYYKLSTFWFKYMYTGNEDIVNHTFKKPHTSTITDSLMFHETLVKPILQM